MQISLYRHMGTQHPLSQYVGQLVAAMASTAVDKVKEVVEAREYVAELLDSLAAAVVRHSKPSRSLEGSKEVNPMLAVIENNKEEMQRKYEEVFSEEIKEKKEKAEKEKTKKVLTELKRKLTKKSNLEEQESVSETEKRETQEKGNKQSKDNTEDKSESKTKEAKTPENKQEKRFTCNICDYKTEHKSHFDTHMIRKHRD